MQNLASGLAERITDGIAALDQEWRFVFVNSPAAALLERDAQKLLGKQIWEELPALVDGPFCRACHGAMAEQNFTQVEQYLPQRDRWIEYRIFPAPDGLTILFSDITDRNLSKAALAASALRLEALLANIQAGVVVEDSEGQLVLANQSFCNMMGLGMPPEALIGVNVLPLARRSSLLFPDGERFIARAQDLRRRQESATAEELRLTDGRVWERDYVPVFPGGSDQGYGGHLWLFRDVTERRRIEQQARDNADLLASQKAALEEANRELEAANARLEVLATTDGLTGLLNERVFTERIREEWLRARRYAEPLSLIMIDLDWFKAFNDTFGHLQGNRVLHQAGRILLEQLRETDILARYGGEEFAVLLPHTVSAEAVALGERIRSAIESYHWDLRPLTVSVGVSELSEEMADAAALIHGADMAMYRSKAAGRNQVTQGF